MKVRNLLAVKLATVLGAFVTAMAMPVHADGLDDMAQAVKNSTVKLNFRYRLESVDQDGAPEDATASTLKSRLTWQSGKMGNVKLNVEVDNVTAIGFKDYNSTTNGKTQYPVVADPEGTDLNLANFMYEDDAFTFVGGRQRIVHDNQRFVGGVAWRQNEQTFDAARFIYKASDAFTIDYSYVFNVNRIFGPNDGVQPADWHGHFHLANAKWILAKNHKLSAFAYLLDNEVISGASSNTFGMNYVGNFGVITANLSYAMQSDAGDNINDYDADYYKVELAAKLSEVKLIAGLEVLGSDNGIGFSTPLATLHKFQGFADKFLGTPGAGIEDMYISAVTTVGGVKLVLTYHDYESEQGSMSYGSEIDFVASYKFNKHVSGLLKFAAYDADQRATDTNKLWAMLNFSF